MLGCRRCRAAGHGDGKLTARRRPSGTAHASHHPCPLHLHRSHVCTIRLTRPACPTSIAGTHAAPAGAAEAGDAAPTHGRRLAQAPATLPACTAQLTTCRAQLSASTTAQKACGTKLTACTQSATAKQLSTCQRRGAAYNGQAATANAHLRRCTTTRDALAKENRWGSKGLLGCVGYGPGALHAGQHPPLTTARQAAHLLRPAPVPLPAASSRRRRPRAACPPPLLLQQPTTWRRARPRWRRCRRRWLP